ncbi:MAG: S8 family peptidase, partial [Nitrospirota bacterium]
MKPHVSCLIKLLVIIVSIFIFAEAGWAEFVPGEVLVKFKDPSNAAVLNKLNSKIGSFKKKDFKNIRVHQIKLPDDVSVEEAVRYYGQDPNVEYAEPNYIVHTMATPNDPSFSSLWGLNNTGQSGGTVDADIDAPEAWELSTGSVDVVIAIVDTGVAYNHPDLNANMWTNSGETNCTDGIDNDNNGYIDDCYGWDFMDNDNDPTDYESHGTHVAGTIAAVGNNATGITGVMWQAKIMPLRFLGVSGSGSVSDAVAAIAYAKRNGAHVINNSWGADVFSQALKDAIDDFPGLVVCAAGNEGTSNDGILPAYPASYTSSNIISVAATNHDDSLASFSNYGPNSVDLAAPGAADITSSTGIYSSIPQFSYGTPVTLYSENFNSQTGALPASGNLLGWRRGGTNST